MGKYFANPYETLFLYLATPSLLYVLNVPDSYKIELFFSSFTLFSQPRAKSWCDVFSKDLKDVILHVTAQTLAFNNG